jgi:hypothetical protein
MGERVAVIISGGNTTAVNFDRNISNDRVWHQPDPAAASAQLSLLGAKHSSFAPRKESWIV